MSERIPGDVARRIRLVVLDVDGVLTDGAVYMGTDSGGAIELKRFDIVDGLGVKLLEQAGIRVAIVSGRESPATRLRAEELGVPSYQAADGFKLSAVERVIDEVGCDWEELAVVGDDLPDLPALRRAGLPVAVHNAVAEVRAVALWHTRRSGGRGAVREFAEALLRARGEWTQVVEEYTRERDPELAT